MPLPNTEDNGRCDTDFNFHCLQEEREQGVEDGR